MASLVPAHRRAVGVRRPISSHLIAVVGLFEVALGLAILIRPFRGLVLFVLAWKLGTEFPRVLAGEPVWEFVERAGDYFLPLSLFVVESWRLAHRPAAEDPRRHVRTGPWAEHPGWRVGAGIAAAALVVPALVVFRGSAAVIESRDVALRAEPGAGGWRPWVLSSPEDIVVASPPDPGSARAEADEAELDRLSIQRSPAVRKTVAKWSGSLPTQPWTETAFEFVSKAAKNPILRAA